MIKSLSVVHKTSNAKAFAELCAFLSSLGFEHGKGWKDSLSEGASFLAPVGNLEVVRSQAQYHTDLWVEVTDLDSVQNVLKKKRVKCVPYVFETDWGARAFTAELIKGLKIAFWQKSRQAQDAIEGDLSARGMRFGIVVARWNSFITERLLQGALDALRRSGCRKEDIMVVRVPGSFEIPSQARTLALTGNYDAIVTLGCLIRGDTTHYEHIATEVTRGIGQSAQESGVPHTYGVLTCETLEQALDRAGLKSGNKGFEAAMSAVEMVSLQRKTRQTSRKRPASKRKSTRR